MINLEVYKDIVSELKKETREAVHLKDYQSLIVASLSIIYIAFTDESINIKAGNISEEDIKRATNILERERKNLKGVFKILISDKIQNTENEIKLIKNMFRELNNIDQISKDDIRNIIHLIIIELDGSKEKSLYTTPDTIKELMIGMIQPFDGMKIADIFSGTGSMLTELNDRYKDYNIELYGEEIDRETYLLSELLLLVNEVKNSTILNKDVYEFKNVKENNFDYVLMDGPFSLSRKDPFKKSKVLSHGVPNKTRVDWAGFQLAEYVLKQTGRAIVTTPTSALSRKSDEKIRSSIIDQDKIEAVIQLPGSLYTNTSISTSLIVFNKNKDNDKKNKIMFIDASNEYVRKNIRQNIIPKESIDKIIKCVNDNQEIEGFSLILDMNTVSDNEYNLNSNVYFNARKLEEELGETIFLDEVAEVMTGVQLTKKDRDVLKNNPTHYYLNIKNIEDGQINYYEDEKIRDKNIDWYGRYDIKAGDIIITTRGTITKIAVVPEDFKDSFISNNLSIIRVNPKRYNPYVLFKYLTSKVGELVLENITSGSSVRVIGANKLNKIKIPDYDVDLMEEIGDRIITNEIEYQSKLEELEDNFNIEDKRIKEALDL